MKLASQTDYLGSIPAEDATFVRLLEARAREIPAKLFFTFGDLGFTYDEFNRRANSMARRLRELGVGTGDSVAILMNSSPEYLTLWFALGKLGAIEVPINTAYHGDMLRHQLVTSQATFAAVDDVFVKPIQEIIDTTTIGSCFVLGDPELPDSRFCPFSELEQQRDESDLGIAVHYSAIGGIIFTSGTTGPSKGVQLSFRYLTSCGLRYADINCLESDDVIMNFLPYFHVAAKNLTIGTLVCGGTMRLLPRLSISGFMDEVFAHGITHFMGVGGICNMLLSRPPQASDAECTIRTIYAVPDPDGAHQELETRFQCKVNTVYGSTEIGLPIARGVHDGYRPESCGRLSPFFEVKIVDDYDNEVPVGEVGEIVVRPKLPYLTASGYIGMPEKTVQAWRNLWLHSGDNGRVDEDGWYYFEDRKGDYMRRRGENISSFEVETLVGKHPLVSEVAAVAYPAETGEDEVRIFVIAREGNSLSAEELFIHCGKTMPYFMVPRYIDVVAEFPRTPTAKVEKYKLRNRDISSSTWGYLENGWVLSREGISKSQT